MVWVAVSDGPSEAGSGLGSRVGLAEALQALHILAHWCLLHPQSQVPVPGIMGIPRVHCANRETICTGLGSLEFTPIPNLVSFGILQREAISPTPDCSGMFRKSSFKGRIHLQPQWWSWAGTWARTWACLTSELLVAKASENGLGPLAAV